MPDVVKPRLPTRPPWIGDEDVLLAATSPRNGDHSVPPAKRLVRSDILKNQLPVKLYQQLGLRDLSRMKRSSCGRGLLDDNDDWRGFLGDPGCFRRGLSAIDLSLVANAIGALPTIPPSNV